MNSFFMNISYFILVLGPHIRKNNKISHSENFWMWLLQQFKDIIIIRLILIKQCIDDICQITTFLVIIEQCYSNITKKRCQ